MYSTSMHIVYITFAFLFVLNWKFPIWKVAFYSNAFLVFFLESTRVNRSLFLLAPESTAYFALALIKTDFYLLTWLQDVSSLASKLLVWLR